MSQTSPEITPATYTVDIAGQSIDLPLIPVGPDLAISLLMVIDQGIRFGEHVGKAIAKKTASLQPDIIVAPATLGIPVAIEVSRQLGLDDYVILQKSPKIHLADALVQEVQSVTTSSSQRILLDRRAIPLLEGRRVLLVDDVIATGSSLAASVALVREAGGYLVGIGTILTEGYDWHGLLGDDARLIHALGHIPQFRITRGQATPIPETL